MQNIGINTVVNTTLAVNKFTLYMMIGMKENIFHAIKNSTVFLEMIAKMMIEMNIMDIRSMKAKTTGTITEKITRHIHPASAGKIV